MVPSLVNGGAEGSKVEPLTILRDYIIISTFI